MRVDVFSGEVLSVLCEALGLKYDKKTSENRIRSLCEKRIHEELNTTLEGSRQNSYLCSSLVLNPGEKADLFQLTIQKMDLSVQNMMAVVKVQLILKPFSKSMILNLLLLKTVEAATKPTSLPSPAGSLTMKRNDSPSSVNTPFSVLGFFLIFSKSIQTIVRTGNNSETQYASKWIKNIKVKVFFRSLSNIK